MLRVLILSDGIPGHVNQSRGLVSWLSRFHEIECYEREVKLRARPLARVVLPHAIGIPGIGKAIGELFYKKHLSEVEFPDLIISTGGNTSFLNIVLAKRWSVPNVFLGSKRRLSSNDFSAHLSLEPTGESHNVVMDLVPTVTDLQEQRVKGKRLRKKLRVTSQQKLYALIVGGDGAGFNYDYRDWREIGSLLKTLSARDNCKWLSTTSRRTGDTGEKLLKAHSRSELLADAVWWSEDPRKIMNSYLGAADAVFVTADSMTMINESIASRKPVIVLEPMDAEPQERYIGALRRFERAGYCQLYKLGTVELPTIPANRSSGLASEKLFFELEKRIPALKRD